MASIYQQDEDLKLIETYANIHDVVQNLPDSLYSKHQLAELREVTEKLGRDLKLYLSKDRDSKEIETMISTAIEEVKNRRKFFGLYEVVPYFEKKETNFLKALHKKALDSSILEVLSSEGVIKLEKEKKKSIKRSIWLGTELEMYAVLGSIEIPSEFSFSEEIIDKISKECVRILYSRIKNEREKYLRHLLRLLDFKHKVGIYHLDPDLWRFFVVIEADRLLDIRGEFIHDLIELSILIEKLRELGEEIAVGKKRPRKNG
ncbi:MAG: hypothetical protein ACE5K4_09350 [Candidatus Hydrothermarchaeota archaeon]